MNKIPLTLTCPVGSEEWPATSFRSVVDATHELQRPGTIHFTCPAGHCFTLVKAMRAKMFTREQGERLIASAQKLGDCYRAAKSFGEIERIMKEARGEGETTNDPG